MDGRGDERDGFRPGDGPGAALDAVFVHSAGRQPDAALLLFERMAAEYGLTADEMAVAVERARQEALAWEIEHPGLHWADSCDCACRTLHPGRRVCTHDADELFPTVADGVPTAIKMCSACARATRSSTVA